MGEMEGTTSKKRRLSDDQGSKTKKRIKSVGDEQLELQKAAILGEVPSLFQMQIEELLKEVKMKKKRQQKLTDCIDKLKDVLMNMSPGKEHKIHDQKWLKDIQMPLVQEPPTTKGCFHFQAPTRIFVGGSAAFNINVGPNKAVDLFLEIPKDCLHAKDCFNHRYIRKRALYLAAVAKRLSKLKMVEDLQFSYHHGNTYKPILVLHVSGGGVPLTIHLHAIPEEGVFKLSRFHISKNNVRPRWYSAQEEGDIDDADSLPPTPVYNSIVLQDICYEANAAFLAQHLEKSPSVQDGIALLKVWLHQRELCMGVGCFSGFLMSMYVCHLLAKGIVRPSMSAFQVLRTTLFQLSNSQWQENPISLCSETGTGNRPDIDQFQQHFDLVFVDVTGYLNLCLDMRKAVYNRVVHESQIASTSLNTEAPENFDLLLMTPCPFQQVFDLTFSVKLTPKSLRLAVEKLGLKDKILDHNCNLVSLVLPRLLDLLEEGFGDRALVIQPQLPPVSSWLVTDRPPIKEADCLLTFGLLLHKSNSLRILDRGPPANSAEAAKFREFWGTKSELRRFKDGGISEAVVWSFTSGLSQKRQVSCKIIAHVLNSHAGIEQDQIDMASQQIENVLHVPRRLLKETAHEEAVKGKKKMGNVVTKYGSGEERIYQIRQVLEELGRMLRGMDLSLRINSVTGIDSVFRFAEVFPAHPVVPKLTSENLLRSDDAPLPLYTTAMTVICSLEGSGKWPEDIARIRDLKALFLIDIADKLSNIGLPVHVQETFVDVMKDGFVFRLKLGVNREIGVLRMVHGAGGILKMEDTPEALAVEAEITTMPSLTIALQGVQQEHPSFCASVRLVKRWMAAQMLLGHVPEVVVEKSVVHIYENPLPFTAPVSPVIGFLRTLKFMASSQFTGMLEKFCEKLATPPLLVILNWLQNVADKSLKVLENNLRDWKVIFKPPVDVYDVVIHLSEHCQARRHQTVEIKTLPEYPRPKLGKQATDKQLPVTGFNPAEMFLENLKTAYGDFALFFHDVYGGDVIAVLLKPDVTKPNSVEVDNLYSQKPTVVNSEPALTFDVDAMILAFETLGGDLVSKIDVHKKWQQ